MDSPKTKYTLNKDEFLKAMESRGWTFSEIYGWLAPQGGFTKQQMEQQWVDSILESI